MDVLEIKGKVNTALCYVKVVEDEAIEQIRRMCDYEFTEGSKIRIMPDVHSGKGCTIGTTMTIKGKAVPNIVGVDIGCGMLTINIGKGDIDFEGIFMNQEIIKATLLEEDDTDILRFQIDEDELDINLNSPECQNSLKKLFTLILEEAVEGSVEIKLEIQDGYSRVMKLLNLQERL